VFPSGDSSLEGFAAFAATTIWDCRGCIDFILGRNINARCFGPRPVLVGYEASVRAGEVGANDVTGVATRFERCRSAYEVPSASGGEFLHNRQFGLWLPGCPSPTFLLSGNDK